MTCWLNVLKNDIIPRAQIVWTQWSKQLHPEALLTTTETRSEKLGEHPGFQSKFLPSTEEEENIRQVKQGMKLLVLGEMQPCL